MALSWLCFSRPAQSASVTNAFPGDGWISNRVKFPAFVARNSIRFTGFERVHAEVLAARLRVVWPGAPTNLTSATVWASADSLGHWPARDWRRFAMKFSGDEADATLPVEDLELPLAYFIEAMGPTTTNASLMRSVLPGDAGLQLPTRVFWTYLDGFEDGADGWRIVSPQGALKMTDVARTGRRGLTVSGVDDGHPVSIGTTRVRGRHFLRPEVEGVSVWLRTRSGNGLARVAMVAQAFSTNEVRAVLPNEIPITAEWRKVAWLKSSMTNLPLTEVDFLSIEFQGAEATEFILDDLELISR